MWDEKFTFNFRCIESIDSIACISCKFCNDSNLPFSLLSLFAASKNGCATLNSSVRWRWRLRFSKHFRRSLINGDRHCKGFHQSERRRSWHKNAKGYRTEQDSKHSIDVWSVLLLVVRYNYCSWDVFYTCSYISLTNSSNIEQ